MKASALILPASFREVGPPIKRGRLVCVEFQIFCFGSLTETLTSNSSALREIPVLCVLQLI